MQSAEQGPLFPITFGCIATDPAARCHSHETRPSPFLCILHSTWYSVQFRQVDRSLPTHACARTTLSPPSESYVRQAGANREQTLEVCAPPCTSVPAENLHCRLVGFSSLVLCNPHSSRVHCIGLCGTLCMCAWQGDKPTRQTFVGGKTHASADCR